MHRVDDFGSAIYLQPGRLAEHDARVARGTLQKDRLPVRVTLIHFVPVWEPHVVHMTIKSGVECERPTEIYGCDLTADYKDIFIRQAHESLVTDIHCLPGTALPAERAGQHTVLQRQHPLIV